MCVNVCICQQVSTAAGENRKNTDGNVVHPWLKWRKAKPEPVRLDRAEAEGPNPPSCGGGSQPGGVCQLGGFASQGGSSMTMTHAWLHKADSTQSHARPKKDNFDTGVGPSFLFCLICFFLKIGLGLLSFRLHFSCFSLLIFTIQKNRAPLHGHPNQT